jgi:hypothetical protein
MFIIDLLGAQSMLWIFDLVRLGNEHCQPLGFTGPYPNPAAIICKFRPAHVAGSGRYFRPVFHYFEIPDGHLDPVVHNFLIYFPDFVGDHAHYHHPIVAVKVGFLSGLSAGADFSKLFYYNLYAVILFKGKRDVVVEFVGVLVLYSAAFNCAVKLWCNHAIRSR